MFTRIMFQNLDIKPHVTPNNLRDIVVNDIVTRYDGKVAEESTSDIVTLDPGGMARFGDGIQWITFQYNGVTFRCQDMHLPNVLIRLGAPKMVDTPAGKLCRIYFHYSVLVVPIDWWQAINQGFKMEEEVGEKAYSDVKASLAGHVLFADDLKADKAPIPEDNN